MFSACTSIKVAVLFTKVADLPKEHSALSTPSFTFSFFSSGFRAAAVGTCSHCRLVPARNRFKGLDLIDRVPDELWMEVHDIVQETGPSPWKRNAKRQNGCLRRPYR